MIEITEAAKQKVIDLLIDENNPNLKLRTFVQGGGCSGFQYGFTFDEEQNEDDFEIMLNDKYKLLIDAMSMNYMQGCGVGQSKRGNAPWIAGASGDRNGRCIGWLVVRSGVYQLEYRTFWTLLTAHHLRYARANGRFANPVITVWEVSDVEIHQIPNLRRRRR